MTDKTQLSGSHARHGTPGYRTAERVRQVITYSGVLAVLIAGVYLFGYRLELPGHIVFAVAGTPLVIALLTDLLPHWRKGKGSAGIGRDAQQCVRLLGRLRPWLAPASVLLWAFAVSLSFSSLEARSRLQKFAELRALESGGYAVRFHTTPVDLGQIVDDMKTVLGDVRQLSFMSTQVADLAPLTILTNMEKLDLRSTPVTDLTPLSRLARLEQLYLRNTPVADLAPLTGLTKLRQLDLRNTAVTDLTPLAGLVNLKQLYLRDTAVTDLSSLAGLSMLEKLDLRHTPVTDLAPLRNLSALQELSLAATPVADVTPLSRLPGLRLLDLRQTAVANLAALGNLPSLQQLHIRSSQVLALAQDVDALRKTLPGLSITR